MIALQTLLVNPAEEAGIKVPPDLDAYDADEYPHWDVFSKVQLGAPMPTPHAHFDNARLIAGLDGEKIKTVTYAELLTLGLAVSMGGP